MSALASYVSGSGVRLVSLSGTGRGNLSLVYRPGSQEAYVIGSDLEPAPSGMVYELWLFHGTTPIPATTFETSGDVVVARVDKDASTSNLVAITIEKSPGTAVPQHKAIFSAPITA